MLINVVCEQQLTIKISNGNRNVSKFTSHRLQIVNYDGKRICKKDINKKIEILFSFTLKLLWLLAVEIGSRVDPIRFRKNR